MATKKITLAKKSDKIRYRESKIIMEHPSLKKYLDNTLRIEKMKEDKKIGGKLGHMDRIEIRNNNHAKEHCLDNYIFRSLANLIYFFEFINTHHNLISKFDEDIEELFGLKVTDDQNLETFRRFIQAILGYPVFNAPSTTDDRFNFQRRLLAIMQSGIIEKCHHYFGGDDYFHKFRERLLSEPFSDDMRNAEAWTKYLDKPTAHQLNRIKRKIVLKFKK